MPIVGFLGQAVFEHDQRGDHVGALDVADVDALDAQWRVLELESLLDALQRSASRGEVTGPLELVLGQGVLRVAVHRFGQRPFVTPLGNPQRHPRAPQLGQPRLELVGGLGQHRHEHLPRDRVGHVVSPAVGSSAQRRLVAVELGEKLLDQILQRGFAGLTGLFDDPAALTTHPPAADVEDLHRSLQLIVGEGDDVGVGAVAEDHRLFLQRAAHRRDVVAQPRSALEIEVDRCVVHLLLHLADQLVGLAGQEVAEITDDAAVLLGADPADARCGTLVDVSEQAGAVNLAVTLEHSVGTGSRGEHAGQQVQGLADGPGVGVGAEVAHPFAPRSPVDHQARVLLVESDREYGVGLVVAVADVEPRIEFLDPVVFELKGFDLGVDDRPLHPGRGHHHLAGTRSESGQVGEVGVQPTAKALGLTDVDDPAVGVLEAVHPGFDGNRPRGRSVRRWIGHSSQATAPPRRLGSVRVATGRQIGPIPLLELADPVHGVHGPQLVHGLDRHHRDVLVVGQVQARPPRTGRE